MKKRLGNRIVRAKNRRLKIYNTRMRKRPRNQKAKIGIKKTKVICDTHIWYHLGEGVIEESEILPNSLLVTTQVNIREFTLTYNLANANDELTRNAIQAAFKYHSIERFEPPLIYLKRLADKRYKYNALKEQYQLITFTSLIAKGHSIDERRKPDFINACKTDRDNLQDAADIFNKEAKKAKANIKNKKKHREIDTIDLNRGLINLFVKEITGDHGLDIGFKWFRIELFENVLKVFLNDLETGAKEVTAKDWMDLFQLIYIKPGEKFWTREKYWIELIKRAGMSKYLYKPK